MDWKKKINEVVELIKAEGFEVVFQPFCEDPETPGILGMYGGVTNRKDKRVKIRTKGMTKRKIHASLKHELDHILNPGIEHVADYPELGLRCGGKLKIFQ